jgi:UDP-2,3-diacylglucosamine pyrophosphatase LpxH
MRTMVAVISDLHFEEEQSDIIAGGSGRRIEFKRNALSSAFEDMMRDVVEMARANNVDQLTFVLAGDVFDLHRTQLWFSGEGNLRPYVDCNSVMPGSPLETKLLSILEAIVSEPEIAKSVAVFNRFAAGHFLDKPGDEISTQPFGFKTALLFIPGNHDRLINSSNALRDRARDILGIQKTAEKFSHQIKFEDPPVFIRHGHEYDKTNFAFDLPGKRIDEALPDNLYDQPAFGDFVTVMIASRLPFCFRKVYGDSEILKDQLLEAIYYRILEFDDVRPQYAVLDFFFNTTIPEALRPNYPNRDAWRKHIWKIITPVIIQVLEDTASEEYFFQWMRKFHKSWVPTLLRLKLWRVFGLPFWLSRAIGIALKNVGAASVPQSYAANEKALDTGVFVVAGHTHQPQLAHLFTNEGSKKYFTDTGTWRNAILTAGDRKSYGRVNATTYVAFYGSERDIAPQPSLKPTHGFEYWSGYDQSWPINGVDG